MAKKIDIPQAEIEACREFRKKLNLAYTHDIVMFRCFDTRNNALLCWEKCPVASKLKDERLVRLPDGQPLPIIAPTDVAKTMEDIGKLGINMDVYEEIDGKKPKKKKISADVEDFLHMQSRVISMLSWHPEIWEALDRLSPGEILDRLIGKTGLAGVPTMVGGQQQFTVSKQTKKMFEDMEKKFAAEDGDKEPNFEEEEPWEGKGKRAGKKKHEEEW